MKFLSILFTFAMCPLFCQYSTDRYYDTDSIRVHGVSSYTVYDVNDGVKDKVKEKLYFDSLGRLTEISNPKQSAWEKFYRDQEGRISKIVNYYPGIIYEVDSMFYSGNVLDSAYVLDSNAQIKYIKRYYYKDTLLIQYKNQCVMPNRNYERNTYYTYDSIGNLIYEGGFSDPKSTQFIRDSLGNISTYILKSDGKTILFDTFKYVQQRRIQTCIQSLQTGYDISYQIVYNEMGLPSEVYACSDCVCGDFTNCSLYEIYEYEIIEK